MILQKVLQASNLAAAPPDEPVPARTVPGRLFWVCGFNHSPFVFELIDDKGAIIGVCQPFAPYQHPLDVRTEVIVIHAASAAMVPAAPLAAGDRAFYIGFSRFKPDFIPTPW